MANAKFMVITKLYFSSRTGTNQFSCVKFNYDELRILITPTVRYNFTGPYTRQAIALLPGNQSYTALCTLIRNNQINPYQFTVALPAHDTLFHSFDY